MSTLPDASIDLIAPDTYRVNVKLPDALPGGFSFNQYLVVDEMPLLFHTGPKKLFPVIRAQIEKVMPLARLRYVAFSHVEADECGSLPEFLRAAPAARPVCSEVAAMVSISDLVDVGRNMLAGARGRVPQRSMRSELLADREVRSPGELVGPYYLRFSVLDRPDILARIAGVLGAFEVSVSELVQDGRSAGSNDAVQLVMITHPSRDAAVRSALREIDRLSGIARPTSAIRIEETA
jgi:hypothetical protein